VHSYKEGKVSVHSFKEKIDSSEDMQAIFQSEVQDDSCLWNFILGHLKF
jgi:hypothetical protein